MNETKQLVSFPRELSDDLAELIAHRARVCGGGAFEIWEAICEGFGQPAGDHKDIAIQALNGLIDSRKELAEQHQGEPAGYARKGNLRNLRLVAHCASIEMTGVPRGDDYVPLYTRADPGEVERLRAEVKRLELMVSQSDYSYDVDRDQMTGRISSLEDLMRKFVRNCEKHQLHHSDHPALSGVRWYLKRFEAALSASAEPEVKS